jgi:hypothetical protein
VRRVRCKEGQLGDLFCKEGAGSGTVDAELERGGSFYERPNIKEGRPGFFFHLQKLKFVPDVQYIEHCQTR